MERDGDDGEPAPRFLTAARDKDYSPKQRVPVPNMPAASETLTSVASRARDAAIRDRALAELKTVLTTGAGVAVPPREPAPMPEPPLTEIAGLLLLLPYGDMMELAKGVVEGDGYKAAATPEEYAKQIHAWAKRQEILP